MKFIRIVSAALAAVIMLSLVSCRGGESHKEEETTELVETQLSVSAEFSVGRVEDNIYKNSYVGIGAELSEDWELCTEDDIKNINSVPAAAGYEELCASLKNAVALTDFYAINKNGTDTVNVTLEKIGSERVKTFSAENYYNENLRYLEKTYADEGYTEIKSEICDVSLSGKSVKALRITALEGTYGAPVYMLFVSGAQNEHSFCITVTAFLEDITKETVGAFFFTE